MTMQMDPIRFRPGQMITFISTKSFALGSTGYNIADGMEVLFDGTNVEVGGNKFTLPTLRGAIRLGWLVPADQYDPDAPMMANPSANIQVRSANDLGQNPMQPARKGAITTIESDERIVMSRGDRTAAANQRTHDVRSQRHGGGVARAFNGGPGGIEVGGAEFGVPVARQFQTAARSDLKVTPDTVGGAIIQAEKVKIQPGQGLDEGEMLARMSDDERAQYLAEKESRKGDVMSRGVGYVPPPPQTTNLAANNQLGSSRQATPARQQRTVVSSDGAAPRQVAQIQTAQRTVQSEGVSASLSMGGGTAIADLSGTGGPVQESVVSAEGITFRNTNGPKKAFPNMQPVNPPAQQPAPALAQQAEGTFPSEDGTQSRIEKDGTSDARKQIAKAICKDFPDEYSFSDHWKRRLAMIRLNYEQRLDVIRAIFAAESDDFKKLLIEEFPEAFAA